MRLTVATSQFAVSRSVEDNAAAIRRHMRRAAKQGARVVHFCEGSLSGYAGADFRSFRGFRWEALRECSEAIAELASELGIWVVMGSAHRLAPGRKPHNSVYVVDDTGRLVDRYDKMFCAGDKTGKTAELAHFTPGEHFCVFEIDGVRCGTLVCHEYRYPELYREYKKRGVDLVFHSFHAANVGRSQLASMRKQVGAQHHALNPGSTLPEITMPASMHAAAAANHVWISASNSSARESCWPSFFLRPDGVIAGKLRRNVPGLLISQVDTRARLYDSTRAWRDRAMRGQFHSGKLVKDARSRRRTEF